MRIPVVRFGDPTTTSGNVHAMHDNMCDDGKPIALHGERATCGNCKGTWLVVGTGYRMRNHGQPVVLHGDRVLCPCGKNRVISMSKGCFYHRTPGEEGRATKASSATSAPPIPRQYDEQFALFDGAHRPLPNVRYRIVTDNGEVITGTTDPLGKTQRVLTYRTSTLKLQVMET
jgi:uncharacterized Zn-binding protein involved in type VI secretion